MGRVILVIQRVFVLRLEEGCNVPVAPRAWGWGVGGDGFLGS